MSRTRTLPMLIIGLDLVPCQSCVLQIRVNTAAKLIEGAVVARVLAGGCASRR